MITVYHNNRCSKSRNAIQFLEDKDIAFEVIKYLENPLGEDQISALLDKLNITPETLIRKNEAIWKEQFKGKVLSDTELISAMAAHPKLIERPIIVNGEKAVIGRPTENIETIL